MLNSQVIWYRFLSMFRKRVIEGYLKRFEVCTYIPMHSPEQDHINFSIAVFIAIKDHIDI